MTPIRPAVALLVGLAVALAGCGKTDPPKPADDKPADKPADGSKPAPKAPTSGTAPQGIAAPQAPAGGPGPVGPRDPAQQAAEKFVADLRAAAGSGAGTVDLLPRLTPAFLKAIGQPALSPGDRALGYSPSAAAGWLARATGPLATVGPPTGYGTPDAVVLVGSFDNGAGRVLLRLAAADGGWQIDWFGLGTAKAADPRYAGADEAAEDFAVLAFLDAVTAGDATAARADRTPLVAAAVTPRLRQQWAEPFGGDKDRGYDYSPAKLAGVADRLGGGAEAYTRTPAGPDAFAVTITKGGAAKSYTLKLAKGPAGGWRVDEFTPQ